MPLTIGGQAAPGCASAHPDAAASRAHSVFQLSVCIAHRNVTAPVDVTGSQVIQAKGACSPFQEVERLLGADAHLGSTFPAPPPLPQAWLWVGV